MLAAEAAAQTGTEVVATLRPDLLRKLGLAVFRGGVIGPNGARLGDASLVAARIITGIGFIGEDHGFGLKLSGPARQYNIVREKLLANESVYGVRVD